MGVPQSSTMVTSMGVGQAATVVKLSPSCVNTGNSLAGVQPTALGVTSAGCGPVPLPPGSTINNKATRRVELSEK
jgi:hypothetical protein